MKKLKIILFITILFGCFLGSNVFAMNSHDIAFVRKDTTVNDNSEIEFNVYPTENSSIDKLQFRLDYDKNIFEDLSNVSVLLNNLGKSVSFDLQSNLVTVENVNNITKSNPLIVKLKLKNNNGIKNVKNINVKLIDISANSGNMAYKLPNKSLSFKLENQNEIKLKTEKNSIVENVDTTMDDSIISTISKIMNFTSLKNLDFASLLTGPLNLFVIFIKAFVIVILINLIAKLICKFMYSSKTVMSSRYRSYKLDKVLKDIYPNNKSIYDFEE